MKLLSPQANKVLVKVPEWLSPKSKAKETFCKIKNAKLMYPSQTKSPRNPRNPREPCMAMLSNCRVGVL